MSNPESFIEEVTEEVRRDRLFALMRRYGWIAVLAIVLLVGGATWNEWRKARQQAGAQALGDAIISAMALEDGAARAAALEQIEAKGDGRALTGLLAAGEELASGDRKAAVARLRALADDANLSQRYRQIAEIKLVMIAGDELSVAERRARIEPLAQPGQPFRLLAVEQLALLAAEEGDTEGAKELLQQILEAADATVGLRQRASQLIVALGGTLDEG